MTSNEEFAAANPAYPCCSVSGSIVAVDAFFGHKLWETFTVPAGYSGANVWGSNPVVDVLRGLVYVGTGNNYHFGTTQETCIKGGGTSASCQSPQDYSDSILALDMYTGHIKWATHLQNWNQQTLGVTNGSDDWNVGCFENTVPGGPIPGPNCPTNGNPVTPTGGPDYDFASSPNEITYLSSHGLKTIIGAGQKSGIYYALDPDTGALLWQTQVGPGSSLGGMEWGSASDGQRIYVSIANLYGIPYGKGASIHAGSWSALDPATGAILWQTADPNGAIDLGPLAVANGVVYAPSMGVYGAWTTSPNMFALDASTGKVAWSFAPGASVIAGATIAENAVYWGSGYVHLSSFLGSGSTTTGTFYAFSIGGF